MSISCRYICARMIQRKYCNPQGTYDANIGSNFIVPALIQYTDIGACNLPVSAENISLVQAMAHLSCIFNDTVAMTWRLKRPSHQQPWYWYFYPWIIRLQHPKHIIITWINFVLILSSYKMNLHRLIYFISKAPSLIYVIWKSYNCPSAGEVTRE